MNGGGASDEFFDLTTSDTVLLISRILFGTGHALKILQPPRIGFADRHSSLPLLKRGRCFFSHEHLNREMPR